MPADQTLIPLTPCNVISSFSMTVFSSPHLHVLPHILPLCWRNKRRFVFVCVFTLYTNRTVWGIVCVCTPSSLIVRDTWVIWQYWTASVVNTLFSVPLCAILAFLLTMTTIHFAEWLVWNVIGAEAGRWLSCVPLRERMTSLLNIEWCVNPQGSGSSFLPATLLATG